MRKALRTILAIISVLLVVFVIGFVVWGETPAQSMPEALASLKSDTQVNVDTGKWLVFTPVVSQPTTGLILYPGGRVDYRSYAPLARQIASQGYLVVIVRMPLNLAVFGVNAAEEVQTAFPRITQWAIGGHSLGGAMAASFAKTHPDEIQGLALWAAYPAPTDDLSQSPLQVVSIYGSVDGLATDGKIDASRTLLPVGTTWVEIPGGNHAQFGWYGDQVGDNPASISRSDQQAQIVAATVGMLESLR